MADTFSAIADA